MKQDSRQTSKTGWLGSKLNRACPLLAASGPIPDIGYVERYVRDGPRAEVSCGPVDSRKLGRFKGLELCCLCSNPDATLMRQ